MTKLEQIKRALHEHTDSMLYFEEQNDPKSIKANVWSFYRTVERIFYPRHLSTGHYNDEVAFSGQQRGLRHETNNGM